MEQNELGIIGKERHVSIANGASFNNEVVGDMIAMYARVAKEMNDNPDLKGYIIASSYGDDSSGGRDNVPKHFPDKLARQVLRKIDFQTDGNEYIQAIPFPDGTLDVHFFYVRHDREFTLDFAFVNCSYVFAASVTLIRGVMKFDSDSKPPEKMQRPPKKKVALPVLPVESPENV